MAEAVKEVAAELGNTLAVSRSSYVDPRIIDRFECGETLGDHIAGQSSLAHIATAGERLGGAK